MEYNNNLDPMFIYYWIKMGCKPIVIKDEQNDREEENEEQN